MTPRRRRRASSSRIAGKWVVKAQVLMGGRGKAGKIKFATTARRRPQASPRRFMATPMPPNRQNPARRTDQLAARRRDARRSRTKPTARSAIDRTTKKPVDHGQPLRRHGHRRSRREASRSRSRSSSWIRRSAIRRSSAASWPSTRELDPGYRKAVSRDRRRALRSVLPLRRQAGRNQSARADRRRHAWSRPMRRWNSTTTRSSAIRSSRSGSTALPLDEDETLATRVGPGHPQLPPLRRQRSGRWPTAPALRWRRWMR